MNRGLFINHLIENECYPDEDCDSEVSQLWHNAINGEVAYVPCEEELTMSSCSSVAYELKIDPPAEYYDYHQVYIGFRLRLAKEQIQNKE